MKRVKIEGMQCRNCAAMVEEALCHIDVVERVRVDLEEGYADVVGAISDDEIINAVTDAGYTVAAIELG
jgi:copper chaperone CopZ